MDTTYSLTAIINGETIKKRGTDLKSLLLKVKPEQVLIESYFIISTGKGKNKTTLERKLNFIETKKLFSQEEYMDYFLNNIYF